MNIPFTVRIDENFLMFPSWTRWLSQYIPFPTMAAHGKLMWKYKKLYFMRKGWKMVNVPQR